MNLSPGVIRDLQFNDRGVAVERLDCDSIGVALQNRPVVRQFATIVVETLGGADHHPPDALDRPGHPRDGRRRVEQLLGWEDIKVVASRARGVLLDDGQLDHRRDVLGGHVVGHLDHSQHVDLRGTEHRRVGPARQVVLLGTDVRVAAAEDHLDGRHEQAGADQQGLDLRPKRRQRASNRPQERLVGP